jgi:competence protein ComEA
VRSTRRGSPRAPQGRLHSLAGGGGGGVARLAKVDINSADVEELDELPEVGPATAEAIIEYRRANGSFTTVDELEGVPGIGPTTIQKIEPFATV